MQALLANMLSQSHTNPGHMEVRIRFNREAEEAVESWLGSGGASAPKAAAAADDTIPHFSKKLRRGGIGSARLTSAVSIRDAGRVVIPCGSAVKC